MSSQKVVAIINTSPDTIELLSQVIEQAGFVVVSGYTYDIRRGKLDFKAFVRQHGPSVVVYDIAPPYERNYRLFEHVRSLACDACQFVLTSTNAAYVQKLAGHDQRIFEVIERPIDLNLIVEEVKQAAKARPTR